MNSYFPKQARQLVDKSHIRLSYVTHYYLDQERPDTVLDLLARYQSYAPELLDVVQFVVVDDCSPLRFAPPDLKPLHPNNTPPKPIFKVVFLPKS